MNTSTMNNFDFVIAPPSEEEIGRDARVDARLTPEYKSDFRPGERAILNHPYFKRLQTIDNDIKLVELEIANLEETIALVPEKYEEKMAKLSDELATLTKKKDTLVELIGQLETEKRTVTQRYIDRELVDEGDDLTEPKTTITDSFDNKFMLRTKAWWTKNKMAILPVLIMFIFEGVLLYTQHNLLHQGLEDNLIINRVLLIGLGYVLVAVLMKFFKQFLETNKPKAYSYFIFGFLFMLLSIGTTGIHIAYPKGGANDAVAVQNEKLFSSDNNNNNTETATTGRTGQISPALRIVRDNDLIFISVYIVLMLGLMYLGLYSSPKTKKQEELNSEATPAKKSKMTLMAQLRKFDSLIDFHQKDVLKVTNEIAAQKSGIETFMVDYKNEMVRIKNSIEEFVTKKANLTAQKERLENEIFAAFEIYCRDFSEEFRNKYPGKALPAFPSEKYIIIYFYNRGSSSE